MSVGIAYNNGNNYYNNAYSRNVNDNLSDSWKESKIDNGKNKILNEQNDLNPMNNTSVVGQQSSILDQNHHSLPNLIKDELLEMGFVSRDLTLKLNSNSKKSNSNPNDSELLKKVTKIMDAYLSHFNIINFQYDYFTNKSNNSNNSLQHPVITSLINLNNKVNILLEKLKSWNNSYFKWWFNVNKLNKYFIRIDDEWKNLLLNISLNNIETSLSNNQLKKEKVFLQSKKELNENPYEMYISGEKYFYGIGMEKSYTNAFKQYTKAAESGIPEAMYMLGLMYEKGYGIQNDICMAIYWYSEAVKLNYGKAFGALGNIYENGVGVLKNDKKAYEYYKDGSDNGEVSCFTSLGRMYENGQFVEENINKAVYWYQMGSQKNCPKAQLALGKIYYYGMSPSHINTTSSTLNFDHDPPYARVEKNFNEAINLFQKSAEQGEPEAQVYLGLCYENGFGVVKDCLMAKMNFEKASKQNSILGALYLGKIYMKENNTNAALNNFLKALSNGSIDALYYIGKLYDNIEEDETSLISSYINSVDSNILKSCNSSYFISSDKSIAIKYYLQAAEKGHSLAQYRLGNYYCTHKQFIIALYWYLKSSHLSKTQNALGQFYELGFDTEFKTAASLTGLTQDCLLHYSVDQLYSFYKHYCQIIQNQKNTGEEGISHRNNKKLRSNLKEAKKWYYHAIRQGNADAAFNLGQLYETRCFDLVTLSTNDNSIDHGEMFTEGYHDPTMNDDISHHFTSIPLQKLTEEEIAEGQSRYIQKAILLYEKAKKLGSKKAAERLKQLQSIAYNQFI
ncbi:HCP-like protein [Piromyces finnis]|uniref:HCP-like protein n=1 Tax=Piromyces finnis TaxID=1754191 RepID=A0A1Y1V738_9FUNG|nr:HCP-like protein [Piromyces finnis]|eukprot:ORX48917.1 HCP-like protein [Piromyces finnis]